ncbi:c-type cytochrome biogenesis protein CcsB [Segniliparus rugosus]|uniref:Cytochrome c-type biogenesis protein CcsB n=1 Tax=Segniliparus rugosus (strain ATCC BAA-974 / DSM 45345 / CCUG 50838 / CIP 108380 / JCM 13579 / CDC 945) TaxID=679197 RepID=E5XP56_SEGRC|nr:c-type cytochrome biogenesis protein CcsB [Segniliparus rugosus]EFV13862.2 cytochrome c-type biogenesis protein CcsB [Segniliparus rugosus ATCC BAA-974]
MPVNETLAGYAGVAFGAALTCYVVAFAALLFEWARAVKEQPAGHEAKELVPAGAPQRPGVVSAPNAGPARTAGERAGRAGFAAMILGWLFHVLVLLLRGFAAGRPPWGNMFEYITLATAAGLLAAMVLLRSDATRRSLVFALGPAVVLLYVAGKWLYTPTAPVVPALKSYWLAIHVSIISTATGVFLVSGVASALYLARERFHNTTWGSRLPAGEALDRVAYQSAVFAFPLFGIGVICGAIWAESAWGRFWGWDPKETISFVVWVIYAAYLHARATAGWKEQRAALINVVGFGMLLFNLFYVNLVQSGLHSYTGLN